MKTSMLLATILLSLGCTNRMPEDVARNGQADEPSAAQKEASSLDGLDDAERDVRLLKKRLAKMSGGKLVVAFEPSPEKPKHGGYDYYYGFMANIAILEEIESRDDTILDALNSQSNNETRVAEAVNGQGLTIGQICIAELARRKRTE